ncbi:hypothetical protein, partial [Streptomyces sp. NPDC002825]|uniref:hypothetical protein n=1 Tax=Streptomyces sp. NPDC002825 TaxID=3154666 RepID=UPI003316F007
ISRSAGYDPASRVIERELRKRNSIPALAPEWNSASGIQKARQFAQARIVGTRASAVALGWL